MRIKMAGFFAVSLFLACSIALAQKITLKDGSVLEGTVIEQPNGYWIKTADGNSRVIPEDEVASVSSGGSATSETPAVKTPVENDSDFRVASSRANNVEAALAAVVIWQDYVDKHENSANLPAAKEQLAHWKTLADAGAEKINGKWVGGDERKKILEQAGDLTREGVQLLEKNQTLKAIEKFQASVKIYPNSFRTNFFLGQVSLFARNVDDAVKYFQVALKLKPQSVETINNLAVARAFKLQWEAAITGFHDAAEIQDTKDIVQNLVDALNQAPANVRNQPRLKKAVEAANLLATGYKITGPAGKYMILPLPPEAPADAGGATDAPAMMWSGTGFFISEDGLILTNRHVAANCKTLMVMIGDQQASADVVVIDDEQDLALIKVKVKQKLPFLQLSKGDAPREGAECTVMGFPMIDRLGGDVKITRGIVSGKEHFEGGGPDVLTDAKVNPGNSGGPILDKHGNVMAIVSMKTISSGMVDSYGMGISAGQIRKFLEKNKVVTAVGPDDGDALSSEDIAAKVTPATVCILATK